MEPSSTTVQQNFVPSLQQQESVGERSTKVKELVEKLDIQARISQRLDENEVMLLDKIKLKDQQFSDL